MFYVFGWLNSYWFKKMIICRLGSHELAAVRIFKCNPVGASMNSLHWDQVKQRRWRRLGWKKRCPNSPSLLWLKSLRSRPTNDPQRPISLYWHRHQRNHHSEHRENPPSNRRQQRLMGAKLPQWRYQWRILGQNRLKVKVKRRRTGPREPMETKPSSSRHRLKGKKKNKCSSIIGFNFHSTFL